MICALPDDVKARYDRSTMKRMIANAAPWSFALKQTYVADFPGDSLWEVYGSTELGVNCILEPADQLRKPGSCGKAAPVWRCGCSTTTATRSPASVPTTRASCSCSRPASFADYYKQHDKYEADMRGAFHTVGDIAYRDDEGFFFICDRKKDMIISGGMNIYPAEIEAALEQHPDIFDVAVFGVPSEEWGESVHAVVVLAPGADAVRRRRGGLRPRSTWPATRCPGRSRSSTSCPAPAQARSSSASCAPPTGPAEPPKSADPLSDLTRVLVLYDSVRAGMRRGWRRPR